MDDDSDLAGLGGRRNSQVHSCLFFLTLTWAAGSFYKKLVEDIYHLTIEMHVLAYNNRWMDDDSDLAGVGVSQVHSCLFFLILAWEAAATASIS